MKRLMLILAVLVVCFFAVPAFAQDNTQDPAIGDKLTANTAVYNFSALSMEKEFRNGVVKKGDTVTVLQVHTEENTRVWIRTSTGWSVYRNQDGKVYFDQAESAVTQDQLSSMASQANGDVSALIDLLNEQYDAASNGWAARGLGFAWNATQVKAGVKIAGPAWFWSDIFDAVQNLPEGVTRISAQGGWGVFAVKAGTEYTISTGSGGRWIKIGNALPEAVKRFAESVPNKIADAVKFLDKSPTAYFAKNQTVLVKEQGWVIVWTDWDGNAPASFEPLKDGLTEGGYGIWVAKAPLSFLNLSNGGGYKLLTDN